MPSTGLSLRSSVHSSHMASALSVRIFSTLPVSTPPSSVMRTSDFSALVSSSMVFHRPTGVAWASAVPAATLSSRAASSVFMRCLLVGLGGRSGPQNSASSMSISGAIPARALRIRPAVSGSSLAK